MSLNYNQNLQEFELFVFTVALVVGASISINPILILEFANDESSGGDVSTIEEIDGDILDPTHPFQTEKRSEELKNNIKKGLEIVIGTEEGTRYVANLPEAGSGPDNLDNSNNEFNNESNNPPSGDTQPTYGTDSQSQILQTNPLTDIPMIKQPDSILDKIQSVMEDSDDSSMQDCTERGPEVNLDHCNFRSANLYGTVLTDADLRDVDFSNAVLQSAYLRGADFSDANLNGANLRGADLIGANLEGASLLDTDFTGAKLTNECLPAGTSFEVDLNGDDVNDLFVVRLPYFDPFCVSLVK